jgi:superfamily II DNA or RNA helicase
LAKITLRDYQTSALKKLLEIRNGLLCVKVGGGKTLIVLFLARLLLKNSAMDKIVVCVTPSAVGPFKDELKNVGIDVNLISSIEELIEFFKSKEKFVLIKHSFMEDLGTNKNSIDLVENYLIKDYKKIMLVVDEAHKFSNHESIGNFAIDNTRRFYEKIVIMTATPYSSKLDQIYGLVKLIYPKRWKDLREFRNNYVKSEIVKDWKTGKFLRTEDVEYINLSTLRKELEEFTYFYFPPIPLTYKEHKAKLKPENYSEYKSMCQEIYKELKDRASGKDKEE